MKFKFYIDEYKEVYIEKERVREVDRGFLKLIQLKRFVCVKYDFWEFIVILGFIVRYMEGRKFCCDLC